MTSVRNELALANAQELINVRDAIYFSSLGFTPHIMRRVPGPPPQKYRRTNRNPTKSATQSA
jgi:hypothetical protein